MGSYEYAKAVAFYETKKSWGGATIGMETLDIVPDGIDAYACAVSEHTIDIPEGPDFLAFSNAFNQAYHDFYGKAVFLGVFHDDDKHTIDFDAVEIVGTTDEVDALNRTRPVIGGAYNFKTGNGYWPVA
jgi:hypothetical protein